MHIIIIILIILALVLLLGSTLISLIIPLAIASLPAWGAGLAVGFGVVFAIRQQRLNSLDSPNTFARVVTLRFDGKKLNCSINDSEFMNYAASQTAIKLSVLSCLGTTAAVLIFLAMATQAFLGHALKFWSIAGDVANVERLSQEASLIIASVICILIITYTFKKAKISDRFNRSIKEEIDRRVSSANLSLKTTNELQSTIKQIEDLSTKLKLSFPDDYNSSIRNYVESHKAELLIDTTSLDRLINSETVRANEDLSNLKKAAKAFDEAMQLYSRTASEVNRTGNKAFFHLLHQLLEGLEGLKSFLPRREWKKFHDGIDFAMSELHHLYENAGSYEHTSEPELGEPILSDPFRILGVTQQMGNTQIRKIYLDLCNIYHPDKGKVPDDTKFKEIQNAYEQIKKMRNF